MRTPDRLVLSCEHATNRVPARWAACFRGARSVLESHRGYDIGALALARQLGRQRRVPVLAARATRLLVEVNRSPHHARLFSEFVAGLDEAEKRRILARYYTPHRARIEAAVASHAARRRCVLHLAVHSFTPVLHGRRRRLDVGLLYDPARAPERALCRRWQALLHEAHPELRVRRNQPYRGRDDGLTRHLRRRFGPRSYLGVELEVSQALLRRGATGRAALERAVADSLERLLDAPGPGA